MVRRWGTCPIRWARALDELGREVRALRGKVEELEAEKAGKTATDTAPEKPRIVASSD